LGASESPGAILSHMWEPLQDSSLLLLLRKAKTSASWASSLQRKCSLQRVLLFQFVSGFIKFARISLCNCVSWPGNGSYFSIY
jgi:hypothetical protein